jgi:hypothetical protein
MLAQRSAHLELAFSLLFSLPGTPMMQYGDEIGIGDDLRLPERECARTPMQWTSERHGGFSTGRHTCAPVINDAVYGFERVNVAEQRRDSESLLNWTERVIRMRKECPRSAGAISSRAHRACPVYWHPLRLARDVTDHAPQLLEPCTVSCDSRWASRTTASSSTSSMGITAGFTRMDSIGCAWIRKRLALVPRRCDRQHTAQ